MSLSHEDKTRELDFLNIAVDIQVNDEINLSEINIHLFDDRGALVGPVLLIAAIVLGGNSVEREGNLIIKTKNSKFYKDNFNLSFKHESVDDIIVTLRNSFNFKK